MVATTAEIRGWPEKRQAEYYAEIFSIYHDHETAGNKKLAAKYDEELQRIRRICRFSIVEMAIFEAKALNKSIGSFVSEQQMCDDLCGIDSEPKYHDPIYH